MWFAILCIIILFYFFIRPAYRVWRAVDTAKRRAREMNDAYRRAAGIDPDQERRQEAQRRQASRKGGWTTPAPKPKKIDPAVGEYIKFKEIDVVAGQRSPDTPDSGHRPPRSIVTEQQVEDVKWEDIV